MKTKLVFAAIQISAPREIKKNSGERNIDYHLVMRTKLNSTNPLVLVFF